MNDVKDSIRKKSVDYYVTTYESIHDTEEEAVKHQAWCDFYGAFIDTPTTLDKERLCVWVDSKTKLYIFLNYIRYCLGATNIYNNYDNIAYPTAVEYNTENNQINIVD